MRSKTIFGALLVSVALCSQGFGMELLDRMLGLNGGCGDCKACAKVACCDPCAKACCPEPACCEKACEPACCEPNNCDPCNKCRCRITPVRDLFAGLKDLFECKGTYCEPVCATDCAPACGEVAVNACEPTCDPCCKPKKCRKPLFGKKNCCEPQCCEPQACEPNCCEPCCKPKCHKLYRRPVLELLEAIFGGRDCCCGEAVCGDGCMTGCGAVATPAVKAPGKAPEKAAPLPAAPKADPSAAVPARGIYQASRSLVRN